MEVSDGRCPLAEVIYYVQVYQFALCLLSSQIGNCTMLPERLLDWFHILRTMHIKEELVRNGLPKPERGEVLPHMKLKEVKMPFPSGRSLNVHVQTVLSLR